MKTETKIYVGTYNKYNSGSIEGDWLTLQDYSDSAELFEAMQELHEDEEDPEFMIQDREGFLSDNIEESMSEMDFDAIYDVINAVEDSHLDFEIIEAYIDNVGCDIGETAVSDAEEAYQGSYDSDEEFAEDIAEQLGCINRKASWPQNCIDWECAARELMYDYFESNGHYFRNL